MRVLVTGATGFLGSRLTHELDALGHTVHIISRVGSTEAQLRGTVPVTRRHVVDERPQSVRRAIVAAQPDIVFHLATYYARDHGPADLSPMLEANIGLPLRLLDAMTREGISRLVNTGSAWQFFESSTYRPVCLHSATKAAFEALLAYFVDVGAVDCVTLVMHDSYGSGDPRRKIFSILRDHAGNTQPLEMSAGKQLVDFIHVDDAVAAFVAAAERLLYPGRTPTHETFSVSGGDPKPLREVVETYLRLAALDVRIDWGGRPYHAREVMRPWAGGTPLPGWAPLIDIETGLRALAAEQISRSGSVVRK